MGVLETRQGSGTRVAQSGERAMAALFEFMMIFDRPTIGDLFAARELIEVHLAEQAAKNRTEADLSALDNALNDLRLADNDPANNPDNGAAANRRFP